MADCLTNGGNKEQLCSLLADHFVSDEIVTVKTIYVTKGSLCLMETLRNGQQMVNELCSNHREADHRYAQLVRSTVRSTVALFTGV